jgi:hypothetical protein
LSADAVLRNVISCADDSSLGTLRQVVGVAGDGDVLDMTAMSCSTITLKNGEISVPVNNLEFDGPFAGPGALTINVESGKSNRIFNHGGTGLLKILRMTLRDGVYANPSGDANGGCIRSSGNVALLGAVVTGCTATASFTGSTAFGGGVYSAGKTTLEASVVSGNSAIATGSTTAGGGGVSAELGISTMFYSTVSGNSATTYCGGLRSSYTVSIDQTTIDSNQAGNIGGVCLRAKGASIHMQLSDSTVSGNTTSGNIAAIFSFAPLQIYNSTIAFNSGGGKSAVYADAGAYIVSSIIARNTLATSGFIDLYIPGPYTLSGSHNLIISSNLGLSDTIKFDPQLGPLADHGGGVRTHALNPASPAVDQGSNPKALSYDERGTGFDREVPNATPDVGAYERQFNDDEIFYCGFD